MRAVVYDRYGPPDVLRLADVEHPVPAADEVVIKVYATTVNRTDCACRSGETFVARLGYSIVTTGSPVKALLKPRRRILGSEVSGTIEAIGSAVREFKVGDVVFGVNAGKFGAHAEYMCIGESAPLTLKPAGMSFDDAAAVCDGAILALGCLRRANLRKGQTILVYGASGSIGTAAVQLPRTFEAHVTAVCNTKNVETVRALGSDVVVDYLQQDFTRNGKTYDVVFDAVGKLSFRRCRGSLKPGGIYLATDGFQNMIWTLWTSLVGDKKAMFDIPPHYLKKDVVFLRDLIEAGKYRAVVDRTYLLEDVVEATRYVETEQKTGNVVLTVGGENG